MPLSNSAQQDSLSAAALDREATALVRDAKFVGRLFALPRGTLLLLLLFAVFHFVVVGLAGTEEAIVPYLLVAGAKVNHLVSGGEWWRLVSSAFLHGTFSHLLVNSLGVLLLGWFLENAVGSSFFLALFVVGATAGSACSWQISEAPSVGASGGMFGILGATLSYSLFNWRKIPAFIRAYVVGLPTVVGVVSIVYGIVASNVDNSAHIAGGVCGLLLGTAYCVFKGSQWAPRVPAAIAGALLALLTVYSLGATVSRLFLRFELPPTSLALASLGEDTALTHFVPAQWVSGVFSEGKCVLGEPVVSSNDVSCYVDPYFSMLLVARSQRMMLTPIYAEFLGRKMQSGAERYPEDHIMVADDPERGLDFALVAYRIIADKYEPLFAAFRAKPTGGATGTGSP